MGESREEVLEQELDRLREERLRVRSEVEEAKREREHLLAQMRDANERLVLATLRADELADEAHAARAVVAASLEIEAEGRRRAEALAAQLQRREEELRSSESQFQTLANTAPMLAWYASPNGDIAWFNQRWYEYTGTIFHEQAGWKWESVVGPDDLPRIVESWRAALASGEAWEDVFRLRRRDGELRWFLSRALPLRDPEGRIVRWFGTNVDINDQKLAEAAKDEFLAMLGHELRNPLTPIVSVLNLMRMRDPTRFVEERDLMERQVKHLVRLVDDLLDISRIAGGKLELRREPVEMATVVARAIEMVGPLVESKLQRLTVNVAVTGLVVDGDVNRLAQLVVNLLTNAVKYTPNGGSIFVTCERRDSRVSVGIRDTGIGISPEMLPRVFDRFAQAPQALDRSEGGLGLGLAIASSLATMHGGTVTARSAGIGHGSELEIDLPASDALIDAGLMGSAVRDATVVHGRRILLVDDNRDLARALAHVLGELGHEVRIANDGRSALAIAEGFVPEVVLLDIGLPGMNGYEVASQLRAVLSPRIIPVIAISGYGQESDLERSREAGFAGHLVKPIDVGTLQDSIHASLSKAATR